MAGDLKDPSGKNRAFQEIAFSQTGGKTTI